MCSTQRREQMAARKPKELDPLDAFAEGDTNRIMAQMLWANRFKEPDMFVKITRDDLEAFDECMYRRCSFGSKA